MPARLVVEDGNVSIYELLGSGDQTRIETMLALYGRLFPKYQHYIPRMRRRAEFGSEHRPGQIVHYWLVEVDGVPAGLRTFRYISHRRCGLAHALAVDLSFRDVSVFGKRLSVFIIYECLAQIIRDAAERGDPPPFGIVNEVEPERLMEHYTHNGLVQLPIKYVEPIFPPEAEGRSRPEELEAVVFSPMRVGFLPNPQVLMKRYPPEIVRDFAIAFLVDHYGLTEDHLTVKKVLDSI